MTAATPTSPALLTPPAGARVGQVAGTLRRDGGLIVEGMMNEAVLARLDVDPPPLPDRTPSGERALPGPAAGAAPRSSSSQQR